MIGFRGGCPRGEGGWGGSPFRREEDRAGGDGKGGEGAATFDQGFRGLGVELLGVEPQP